MITVALKGGIGNQLFQYFFGSELALRNGTGLKCDTAWYHENEDRKLEIGRLLPIKKAKFQSVRRKFGIQEPSMRFNPRLLEAGDGSYLSGNFQSDKYSPNVSPFLIAKIQYKAHMLGWNFLGKEFFDVFVHIRGGDFRTNPINYTLGSDYYREAFEVLKLRKPKVCVFTDDIDLSRSVLSLVKAGDVKRFHTGDDLKDLIFMSQAPRLVMANSTFSFWAAKIGNPMDVVCPKKYFAKDEMNAEMGDFYPDEFIQI